MKKLVLCIGFIVLCSNCLFAKTIEKEYQVNVIDNDKEISYETLSKLYAKADYDIYVNNSKLNNEVLNKIKENNDSYHYIGYTEDNKHFFESLYSYNLYLQNETTELQTEESEKEIEETKKEIVEEETTKKEIVKTKSDDKKEKEEEETKKEKETTKEVEKKKETEKKETKKKTETTISFNIEELTKKPELEEEEIIQEEVPVSLNRIEWCNKYNDKIFSPRELISALTKLNESSIISISSIVQRKIFEYDKSEVTIDILTELARQEGKPNYKLVPKKDNDEYIYFTFSQFANP